MKSSLLRTFFEWALMTSVLMSVGFFAWYYYKSHAVRVYTVAINNDQANLQRNTQVMGMLIAECQQYGRTNADMARLLAPPRPAPAAPAPTATKPAARPGTR